MLDLFAWLSTGIFFLSAFFYAWSFIKVDVKIAVIARTALYLAVAVNIIYMVMLSLVLERFPLSSFSQAFSFIAVSMAVAYIFIEIITRNTGTGFLILILVSLLKTVSLIFAKHATEVNPILADWHFVLHVIPATLGYTGFALSMIYGILYLALYRELHKKRFGPFYKRLPPLEAMESMVRISVKLGFILLTVGIVSGFPLIKTAFMTYYKPDPKLLVVTLIWFLYLAFIIVSSVFSWKGKRYALTSVAGFAVVVMAMLYVEIFMKSFHKFV